MHATTAVWCMVLVPHICDLAIHIISWILGAINRIPISASHLHCNDIECFTPWSIQLTIATTIRITMRYLLHNCSAAAAQPEKWDEIKIYSCICLSLNSSLTHDRGWNAADDTKLYTSQTSVQTRLVLLRVQVCTPDV